MVEQERVFIDTWGWLALGHQRDQRHEEVVRLYATLRSNDAQLYTSDYVLDELISLLFRREHFAEATRFMEGIFSAASAGYLQIERVTRERFSGAWKLRTRFQDKPSISFADLTSILIMSKHVIRKVLTEDEHFTHVGMGFVRLPGVNK